MVEAKKDGSPASDPDFDRGLSSMDPAAIKKQIQAETEAYHKMRREQGKKPDKKPDKGDGGERKNAPSVKKPRDKEDWERWMGL